MIQGLPGGIPLLDPTAPRADVPRPSVDRRPAVSAPQAPPRDSTSRDVASPESSAAPQGVDPSLWSVLTAEERAFFGRSHARGPLTYGRGAARGAPAAPPAGGRLDLRV